MNIRSILLLLGTLAPLGVAPLCYASIYEISRWHKKENGQDRYLYRLSDSHVDYGNQRISDKQRADIVAVAKKNNAYVIVEDAHDYRGDQEQIKQTVEIDMRAHRDFRTQLSDQILYPLTPLLGLTNACALENLKVHNIEFRYYPLRSANFDDTHFSDPQSAIQQKHKKDVIAMFGKAPRPTLRILVESLFNIYTEIKDYNDPKLKPYYDAIMNSEPSRFFGGFLTKIQEDRDLMARICEVNSLNECLQDSIQCSVKYSCKSYTKEQVLAKAEQQRNDVIDARDSWLDARIMHRVAQSDAEVMLVCSGGSHSDAITPGLKALGWKQIDSVGLSTRLAGALSNEYILSQSIDIADYFNQVPLRDQEYKRKLTIKRCIFALGSSAVIAAAYLGYRWYTRS